MEIRRRAQSLYPQAQLWQPSVLSATLPWWSSGGAQGHQPVRSHESSAHSRHPTPRGTPPPRSAPCPSHTLRYSSVPQLECFTLTYVTYRYHSWVNISPIFFLSPLLFSHQWLPCCSRDESSLATMLIGFSNSQKRRIAVSVSHQVCKGFTCSCGYYV